MSSYSDWYDTVRVVLQGSILGPLFLNSFINECNFPNICNFTNDNKKYSTIMQYI